MLRAGHRRVVGGVVPVRRVDGHELLGGWGVRPGDWQFAASIQQEVLARIGEEDISVVVRDHAPLRPDETIHLVIDPAKLFVFDKATGLRLR